MKRRLGQVWLPQPPVCLGQLAERIGEIADIVGISVARKRQRLKGGNRRFGCGAMVFRAIRVSVQLGQRRERPGTVVLERSAAVGKSAVIDRRLPARQVELLRPS